MPQTKPEKKYEAPEDGEILRTLLAELREGMTINVDAVNKATRTLEAKAAGSCPHLKVMKIQTARTHIKKCENCGDELP